MVYCAPMKIRSNPVRPTYRFIITVLFGVVILIPFHIVSAQDATVLSTLSESEMAQLRTDGSLARTITDVDEIALAPSIDGVDEALRDLGRMRANIISERLVFVGTSVGDDAVREVYNALLGVGQLSGLQYYNPEKDVWHTLFNDSYRINDGEDRSPLPDLSVSEIPQDLEITVFQDLPPFGGVVQEYRYAGMTVNGRGGFAFTSENEEELRYRRVRVVKPGEMRTYAWLIRGDDYLLLYGIGAARVFTGFGLFRDRIENSFTSRTDGLFDWLTVNYLQKM
jgi:hypothetical protein